MLRFEKCPLLDGYVLAGGQFLADEKINNLGVLGN